jgi:hypothetical protein
MCWLCDHPRATRFDYLDHLRDLISWHGWTVQGVERDRLRPPWAYTIGLTEHGLPELVVTGIPLVPAAELLDDVAAHCLHAKPPEPGERVELVDGPVIEIVEVAEPTIHLVNAVEIYGPRITALQIVHADDRKHWPWEVGYRGIRGGQPVLGMRSHPSADAA